MTILFAVTANCHLYLQHLRDQRKVISLCIFVFSWS